MIARPLGCCLAPLAITARRLFGDPLKRAAARPPNHAACDGLPLPIKLLSLRALQRWDCLRFRLAPIGVGGIVAALLIARDLISGALALLLSHLLRGALVLLLPRLFGCRATGLFCSRLLCNGLTLGVVPRGGFSHGTALRILAGALRGGALVLVVGRSPIATRGLLPTGRRVSGLATAPPAGPPAAPRTRAALVSTIATAPIARRLPTLAAAAIAASLAAIEQYSGLRKR